MIGTFVDKNLTSSPFSPPPYFSLSYQFSYTYMISKKNESNQPNQIKSNLKSMNNWNCRYL